MTESHPKLARIRALLAKAEATDFPAEATTYREKAYALLAEYGIDEALALAEGRTRDEVGQREIVIEGSYVADFRALVHNIATALGCTTFGYDERDVTGKRYFRVIVFGYTSDLERIELLYTSLYIQALRGMQDAPQGHTARNTMANRRAWLQGFRIEVHLRLAEAERLARGVSEGTSGGTSTELVVRDRKVAVQESYDTFIAEYKASGMRVHTRRTRTTGYGYGQGREAGRRADIGGKKVGGARTAIGG